MDVFKHLISRVTKTQKGLNRILKGDIEMLRQFDQDASVLKKIKFHLHIVQPGLKKSDAPDDILLLLGVVQNYAREVCNAELTVHCSR